MDQCLEAPSDAIFDGSQENIDTEMLPANKGKRQHRRTQGGKQSKAHIAQSIISGHFHRCNLHAHVRKNKTFFSDSRQH